MRPPATDRGVFLSDRGHATLPPSCVDERPDRTSQQQDRQNDRELQRIENAGLHDPPVVNDAKDSCDVNQPMKQLPTLAELANGPLRRCECEGKQQQPRREASDDVAASTQISHQCVPVKVGIELEGAQKMNACIEER